jgi:hypothetical protein
MLRPAFAIGRFAEPLLEPSTRIRLEIRHDFLRFGICCHYDVDVRGPDMAGVQLPMAMANDLLYGFKDNGSAPLIK